MLAREQRRGVLPPRGCLAIEVSGPGASAVRRWAAAADTAKTRDEPVILAGVAGALRSHTPSGAALAGGTAWNVTFVCDGDGGGVGGSWRPTLAADPSLPGARLVSRTSTVVAPVDKHRLGRDADCDLVDLESVAFAMEAESRGWTWAIVRGVSDDVDTALPASVERWIDARGRSRPGRVLAAIARRPSTIRDVRMLHRNGRAAILAVGRLIGQLLRK